MSKSEDIDALLEQFQKSGVRELHLRCEEIEIYLSTDSAAAGIFRRAASPAPQVPAAAAADAAQVRAGTAATPRTKDPAPPATVQWPANALLVRAPYLGTFYRAPKPGAPAYVEVGAQVVPETELCMVEVMKLFTALRAGIRGKVHAVLAEDGQLVQAEQLLFVMLPSP